MTTIEDVLKCYDEFVAKALSKNLDESNEADAAYREIWILLRADEKQYLSFARVEGMDGAVELVEEFQAVAAEVRSRLVARLLS